MIRFICIALLIVFAFRASAQESYSIKPLFELNSAQDEIACVMFNDQLIVMKAQSPDLVNDY